MSDDHVDALLYLSPTQVLTVACTMTALDTREEDIYRGEQPVHSPEFDQLDSLTSMSSDSSFLGIRRLGAIAAAVVENAITRWARGATSSSADSSSDSHVSMTTETRSSYSRRRNKLKGRQRLREEFSEHEFAARINIVKARKVSRRAPRQFILYLPPYFVQGRSAREDNQKEELRISSKDAKGMTSTTSLSIVLGRLDRALKSSSKARKNQEKRLGHSRMGKWALER
jgi:magnesium transporter